MSDSSINFTGTQEEPPILSMMHGTDEPHITFWLNEGDERLVLNHRGMFILNGEDVTDEPEVVVEWLRKFGVEYAEQMKNHTIGTFTTKAV